MEGGCDCCDMEIQTTPGFPKTCVTPAKNNGQVLVGPRNIGRERGDSIVVISEVHVESVDISVIFIFVTWIVVIVSSSNTWIINRAGVEGNKDLLKLTHHVIELGLYGK